MHLFVVRSLQQDPTVLGAHGKCVGSLKIWDKSNQVRLLFVYWPLHLLCCWIESLSYPQQGLFVLAVFHFCRRQIDDGPLHAVPLAAVQVDVGPAHHNVTLYPATGVRFQEVQITFLGHDRARNKHIMNLRGNEMRLFLENATSHEEDLGIGIVFFWPNTDFLYVWNKCVSFESPLLVHRAEWVQIWRWSSRGGFSESISNKWVQ